MINSDKTMSVILVNVVIFYYRGHVDLFAKRILITDDFAVFRCIHYLFGIAYSKVNKSRTEQRLLHINIEILLGLLRKTTKYMLFINVSTNTLP